MPNDLKWEVVRKDTGEVVAAFARPNHAEAWKLEHEAVRPAPSRTCAGCRNYAKGTDGFPCCKVLFIDDFPPSADFGCNRWEEKDNGK